MSAQIGWTDQQADVRPHLTLKEFWALVLEPLASLKLTVILFALSIFIIFAGTLAQVDKDIWEVIRIYFRAPIAWIDPLIFFPPSFFPDALRPKFLAGYAFPFPGGWLIGAVMALNLVAAHLVRFQVQARGARLVFGLLVMAVGCVLTWLVIKFGSNKDGILEESQATYDYLWTWLRLLLAGAWCGLAVMLYQGWASVWRQPLMTPDESILASVMRFRILIGLSVLLAVLGYVLFHYTEHRLSDPSMRILWQLSKGSIAGIVLLAGGWLVFGKRAGIVLIHGGVGLMMFGELLVGLVAVEGQMPITEGQTANYVHDIRTWELAVIEPTDSKDDKVIIIPKGALQASFAKKQPISDPKLPFRLEVLDIIPNGQPRPLKPDETPIATQGLGATVMVDPLKPGAGTDSGGKIDQTAAYVKLTSNDGADLGTYLVGLTFSMLNFHDDVTVGGKTYHLGLRFKRTYKPYSVALKDVRNDTYIGTKITKNYSSDVVLNDDTRNVHGREVKIWMNNPLRFGGETFYQSGYFKDPQSGEETTTLAVVSNTGWMIPYVSCMIVAIGMLVHFSITLMRFLQRADRMGNAGELAVDTEVAIHDPRRRPAKPATPLAVSQPPLGVAGWALPATVVTLAAIGAGMQARVPHPIEGQFDLYRFGQLPVVADGRAKPVDTLARHTLLALSSKPTFMDDNEERQPAIRWFLEMIAAPKPGDDHPVIPIEDLEVQQLLKLPQRDGFRYSLKEIMARRQELSDAAQDADKTPADQRSGLQRKVLELLHKLDIIAAAKPGDKHHVIRIENLEVQQLLKLPRREGFRYSLNEIMSRRQELGDAAKEADKTPADQRSAYQRKVLELVHKLDIYDIVHYAFYVEDPQKGSVEERIERIVGQIRLQAMLKEKHPPLATPPTADDDEWQTYAHAAVFNIVKRETKKSDVNPFAQAWTNIFAAYRERKPDAFNAEVEKLHRLYQEQTPKDMNLARVDFEAYFNRVQPMTLAIGMYLLAFVIAVVGWLCLAFDWRAGMQIAWRTAFALTAFSLIVHTEALRDRIYISGRPPVTNLYSSAVFIGWGCAVMGLLLEAVFRIVLKRRIGLGNVVAAVAGYSTLLIAHHLESDGSDTFSVMQAVLDTQFWLATHVTCITLGYATTYLAGLLGLLYILLGVATPWLTPQLAKDLNRMTYGTLCFSIFFSFVGTVLGGLWADDSWGRFWGWDPKENGALMIVLWNALTLHARWGKLVNERGLAVLAVAGNIVVSWSWFGVNALSVGLHSYGFDSRIFTLFCTLMFAHLPIIALGMLPPEMWRSGRKVVV